MRLIALTILGLIAVLPRTLTLLHLWQLKEWRVDRLREHLKREGVIHQLWGNTEPFIVAALMLAHVYLAKDIRWTFGLLGLLILIQLARVSAKRQILPRWTQKAIALFVIDLTITALFAFWLSLSPLLYPGLLMLPLVQPFFILLGWILLKPLDIFLKQRILSRAKTIRKQFPDLTVIGITGSAGKTTTKELLGHILHEKKALVTPLHVNTELGVSSWMTDALTKHKETEILIVEMGAYRRGEIKLLCDITKPKFGIITSIGLQHLALFGSAEAILSAKGELFASLPQDGTAFLNADDPAAAALQKRAQCKHIRVGTGKGAEIIATDIVETSHGMQFTVDHVQCTVPVFGTHNVTNALLAIAASKELGMTLSDIVKRLKDFKTPAKTFSVRTERGIKILDDTYNASPDSFRAAIRWARNQPHTEKFLIFSGIIELGKDEYSIHRSLGEFSQDLFSHLYMTNNKFIRPFEQGIAQKVEFISENSDSIKVPRDALLVCIGRMSSHTIEKLLP